ncbi:MAG: 3-phosphoshikimate 1-carboxyvinyltransferase [Candidatus Schekmanbacteria bacterium]|nr:3-phosphoshikimate 1-carboxyvinyltransferase [Candidatus Schekmanbacteria bacterium]
MTTNDNSFPDLAAAAARRVRCARAPVRARLAVPPDKSISHRAVLFGALAQGPSRIANFLVAADTLSSVAFVRALGAAVEIRETGIATADVVVTGQGARETGASGSANASWNLGPVADLLDCGNSGTTMRLGLGILAALPVAAFLTGDASLRRRPMRRVLDPLGAMGATWMASGGGTPPLAIRGPLTRPLPAPYQVFSAQVKSALLLAGLCAPAPVELTETASCRDHTERALVPMGARIERSGSLVVAYPGAHLHPVDIRVPGDFSSAAFLMAAAAIVPGSAIEIAGVGLNPTRTAFADALAAMGARVLLTPDATSRPPESASAPLCDQATGPSSEPTGTIAVTAADLAGIALGPAECAAMIDEIPLLAVLATQAHGKTVARGARELRYKESDRIATISAGLEALGAEVTQLEDGFEISGPQQLTGAAVNSFGDHRIAMCMAIAGLVAEGETAIVDSGAVDVSFPGFFSVLEELR